MKYKYAVTHPGTAHRDDTLTSCMLVASGVPVYRHEPTPEELEDHRILVFDAGGQFDIGKSNFDHHHDANLPCALLLVLEYVFGWDMNLAKEVFPWLVAVDMQDRRGPLAMLEYLHCHPGSAPMLRDPLGSGIVRLFGQSEKLLVHPSISDPLVDIMSEIGKNILSTYYKYEIDKDNLREVILAGETVLWTDQGKNSALFPEAARRGIRIVVAPNLRGPGFVVTRVNDAPGVDFMNAHKVDGVSFVHNSGFMCVCKNTVAIAGAIREACK